MKVLYSMGRWLVPMLLLALLVAGFLYLRTAGNLRTVGSVTTLDEQDIAAVAPTPLVTEAPTTTPTVTNRQIEEIFFYAADGLGVVVDENVKVLHVEVGNSAERAGLQVGDILETLDGVSIAKDRELVKEMLRANSHGQLQPEKRFKLLLRRGDQELEIEVNPGPMLPEPGEVGATPVWPPQDYF